LQIASVPVTLAAQKPFADAEVSPFGHTVFFSDGPQVHSCSGDVIYDGTFMSGFEKKIALTAYTSRF
jgi:hypothetical protein